MTRGLQREQKPVLQKLESMENSSKKEPDPVQKNLEDTPPDWGGDDDDSDSTTEVAKPREREAEDVTGDQWPWGPAGRPRGKWRAHGTKTQRTCGGATAMAQPVWGH